MISVTISQNKSRSSALNGTFVKNGALKKKIADLATDSSRKQDLNAIGMLWFDHQLAVHTGKPSNMTELKQFCSEE